MPKLLYRTHTITYTQKLKQFQKLYEQGYPRQFIMKELSIGKTSYYKLQSNMLEQTSNISPLPKPTKDNIVINQLLNTYRNAAIEYQRTKDTRYRYRLLRLQSRLAISIMRARLASISKEELESFDKYWRKISRALDSLKGNILDSILNRITSLH
jgi:hypothetical protein